MDLAGTHPPVSTPTPTGETPTLNHRSTLDLAVAGAVDAAHLSIIITILLIAPAVLAMVMGGRNGAAARAHPTHPTRSAEHNRRTHHTRRGVEVAAVLAHGRRHSAGC